MGKDSLIQYDERELKQFKKFAKTLPRRAEAVMRYLTLQMAKQTMAAVQSNAPSDMEYADYLEVLRVKSDQVGYVIAYMGKPEPIEETDSEATIYYYKPLKRKQKASASLVRLLRQYGPYTQEMLPLQVDESVAKIVFRECSAQEVLAVRKRNQKQESELRGELLRLGIKVPAARSKKDLKDAEVFSDLAFKVLRREYGVRAKSNPHWRPAIRKVVSEQALAGLMASPQVHKILTDPSYQGWRRLAMIGNTMPLGDLKELEEFQKMILGGSGNKDV